VSLQRLANHEDSVKKGLTKNLKTTRPCVLCFRSNPVRVSGAPVEDGDVLLSL
jgi:hypothetical protein